jgi:hypothetical protein
MAHRAGYCRLSGTSSRLDLMARRAPLLDQPTGANVTGRGTGFRMFVCGFSAIPANGRGRRRGRVEVSEE